MKKLVVLLVVLAMALSTAAWAAEFSPKSNDYVATSRGDTPYGGLGINFKELSVGPQSPVTYLVTAEAEATYSAGTVTESLVANAQFQADRKGTITGKMIIPAPESESKILAVSYVNVLLMDVTNGVQVQFKNQHKDLR